MELWDELDEVLGAGFPFGGMMYSLYLGHTEIAALCGTGIVTLIYKKTKEG